MHSDGSDTQPLALAYRLQISSPLLADSVVVEDDPMATVVAVELVVVKELVAVVVVVVGVEEVVVVVLVAGGVVVDAAEQTSSQSSLPGTALPGSGTGSSPQRYSCIGSAQTRASISHRSPLNGAPHSHWPVPPSA